MLIFDSSRIIMYVFAHPMKSLEPMSSVVRSFVCLGLCLVCGGLVEVEGDVCVCVRVVSGCRSDVGCRRRLM